MKSRFTIFTICSLLLAACTVPTQDVTMPLLNVSDNNRFMITDDGDPFFWLGDTGWLLFKKLDREEAELYLENRKNKGFNVIQAMVIHNIMNTANIYGDSAVVRNNVSKPLVTEGNSFEISEEYDYWDHVDFIIDKAAEKGIYMALVPIWGSNVRGGHVTVDEAKIYATFLAERYKDKPNIIWLNGGDVRGSDSTDVWNALGLTLNQVDDNHLITFHPFGRTMSSDWFHNESWLDFNMFQSGHRRYDQDDTERGYGQDSWRYVLDDYKKVPAKPTVDGEPSYEQIPQGLHDSTQGYWTDSDLRRYAYWSVFAGGCGFTYGHNAVMQFHKDTSLKGAFGVKHTWQEGIDHPGAGQMIYLKNLMLNKPYFERIPDQSLIAENQGEKYDYLIATRGNNYAFIYTYTGRPMSIAMGKISGEKVAACWFSPRDGSQQDIGVFENTGTHEFDPPGEIQDGNDWVLILDSVE